MNMENVAAAAKKKTEQDIGRLPEDVAREALEDLEKRVENGEWDPEEFGETQEQEQKTMVARPKKV